MLNQTLINFGMGSAALTLMLLGLACVLLMKDTDPWTRRFFRLFATVSTLYVFCNLSGQIAEAVGAPVKWWIFFESISSSFLMPMLTVYLMHCAGRRLYNPWTYAVMGLWLVYFLLLTSTLYSPAIYYFTPEGDYHRGAFYPWLLAPAVGIMLLNLAALVSLRGSLARREFTAMLIYNLVPMLSMIAQIIFYGYYLIVYGTAIASAFLYLFIMKEQADRANSRLEENARQRASIMVLQMRPHFIANTMTSIYYLCQSDPKKAQQVILDFSSYLRRNFTAIAKEDRVPFTDELEHARAFLAVDQVRFEGQLFVRWDTPHTDFTLPALTLQPIVENAVRYGVEQERRPLTISVTTRATSRGSEITVEDDGPGFGEGRDKSGTHTALDNIRGRLAMMCGGTLTIAARPGGGTVVTIVVPGKRTLVHEVGLAPS